jgi:hypothetical protein
LKVLLRILPRPTDVLVIKADKVEAFMEDQVPVVIGETQLEVLRIEDDPVTLFRVASNRRGAADVRGENLS